MPRQEDLEYLEGIPDDEPVLIFLAQDRCALAAADGWMMKAIQCDVAQEKRAILLDRAGEIANWQRANEDKVKVPD